MARIVLVADDSPSISRRAVAILKGEGYQVETVPNGVAAIKRLATLLPALVLADVAMPGRDGYEVCEFVKKSPEHHHVPVLLISSDMEPYDAARGAAVHANGTVKKPFVPEELLEAVARFAGPPEVLPTVPATAVEEGALTGRGASAAPAPGAAGTAGEQPVGPAQVQTAVEEASPFPLPPPPATEAVGMAGEQAAGAEIPNFESQISNVPGAAPRPDETLVAGPGFASAADLRLYFGAPPQETPVSGPGLGSALDLSPDFGARPQETPAVGPGLGSALDLTPDFGARPEETVAAGPGLGSTLDLTPDFEARPQETIVAGPELGTAPELAPDLAVTAIPAKVGEPISPEPGGEVCAGFEGASLVPAAEEPEVSPAELPVAEHPPAALASPEPQVSDLESQISDLQSQISNLKSQIAELESAPPQPEPAPIPAAAPRELDPVQVGIIVRRTVTKMSPAALPREVTEEMAERLTGEILAEIAAEAGTL